MTQAEYARHVGISRVAVHHQVKSGLLPTRQGRVLVAAADHARATKLDPAKGGKGGGAPRAEFQAQQSPAGHTMADARMALTAAQAARTKLDLDLKRGLYVLKTEVEGQAYEEGTRVREMLKNWPSREAALLASKLKIPERQLLAELEGAMNRLLLEIAGREGQV